MTSPATQQHFDPAVLQRLGVPIERLCADSRRVQPGDTFVAYPGEAHDGRRHIADAIAAGAAAVLWERQGYAWDAAWQLPNLGIEGLRGAVGDIASHVYGHPSRQLWVIGVTGTNGKTSCAHWLAQSLSALGRKAAVLGTLGNGFPGALSASPNTTPDAIAVHALLREYLDQGAQCVAMEVSSHGLAQGRVNGVAFDVALLTNLSRDHLDYHGDMQTYARTKAGLFAWRGLKHAVLNLDDEFGADLAQAIDRGRTNVVGYGQLHGEVHGRDLELTGAGLEMLVHTPWGDGRMRSGLLGAFNASNLLGVLATLLVSDVKLDDALRQLSAVTAPPGRMQRLGGDGAPLVVVDYAHTPDALEKVLRTLREIMALPKPDAAARHPVLACVFGCGGERDKGKRPLMGEVAARMADSVIVTSDNPRGEDARAIIADIIAGLGANHHIIEDRASAIYHAVTQAQPGDIVLIAGKGHEQYQEMHGEKLPFSDLDVAQRALRDAHRSAS